MKPMPRAISNAMRDDGPPPVDGMTPAQARRGMERMMTQRMGLSRAQARAKIAAIANAPMPRDNPKLGDIDDDDVKALVEAMLG